MKAELIFRQRTQLDDTSLAELVIWQVPRPLAGSAHHFKYSLAYVENEVCVIRYDNEVGKGDHRHIGRKEMPYAFVDMDQMMVDFWTDVAGWRRE